MDNFWKDKRVLVTGHTGFKGTWLVIMLSSLGADITGISVDENDSRIIWHSVKAHLKIQSRFGDITSRQTINSIFNEIKPEIVFHLAAQPLVFQAYLDPYTTVNTNVIGSINILEATRKYKTIRSLVLVTSDKVYSETGLTPYQENSVLGGEEMYSASKACVEILVSAYRNAFKKDLSVSQCGIATVRAGNVFGGGDWSSKRLVPDIFKCILNGEKLFIRNPKSVRPWQHIFDVTHGYLLLAQKLYSEPNVYSTSWNFSNPLMEFSVNKMVLEFNNLIKKNFNIELQTTSSEDEAAEFYESEVLAISSVKANKLLNWYPKMSLDEAIEETSNWYFSDYKNTDSRETYELCNRALNNFWGKYE